MKRILSVYCVMAVFFVVSFIFTGCGDRPVLAPSESTPIFYSYVFANDYYWDEANDTSMWNLNNVVVMGSVQASPRASSISIALNNKTPTRASVDFSGMSMWGLLYESYYVGESFAGAKTVTITSDIGSSTGTITIPIPVVLVSPRNYDTVSPYQDIPVTWTGNADWYLVDVSVISSSYTTYERSVIFRDSLVTGNIFIIPASAISASATMICLYIYSYNGPIPGGGVSGNMAGNGSGFLYAMNYTGNYDDYHADVRLEGRTSYGGFLAKTAATEYREDLQGKLMRKLFGQIGQ